MGRIAQAGNSATEGEGVGVSVIAGICVGVGVSVGAKVGVGEGGVLTAKLLAMLVVML